MKTTSIIEAGRSLGIPFVEIEERYWGTFATVADFARDFIAGLDLDERVTLQGFDGGLEEYGRYLLEPPGEGFQQCGEHYFKRW